ncbi:GGDEF domain-containing protein [Treponema socranskii]|uniref:GGDEF domain-containing protein n=1 Tax=Treponema socranskii TaxID=53419 RepID=UPI003D6DE2F7
MIWILGEYGYILDYTRSANIVVCFFSIFLISVISFLMFVYVQIRLKTAFLRKRKLWFFASIPLAFSLFMCLASYYTGWIYYITPDVQYRRGPYYCWQMAVVFFYFVLAVFQVLYCGAKERMPMRRRATFSLALAITVSVVIGSLQMVISGTPIIVIAIFSGFLVIFINFQRAQIFSDALTELNNRRRANQYLEMKFNSPLTEWPLYLFMFDINSFKEINDTYGHIEGDKALRIVAQALRMTSQKYSTFAARFGGDEFLLIGESLYVSSPDELINHFNKALEAEVAARRLPYTVTLSIGYAKTDGQSISIVELIKKADDMLYKNKSRAHSAAPPPPPPTTGV